MNGGLEHGAGAGARYWTALTREVSATLSQCELSHQPRVAIDVERARRQHAAYRAALAEAGAQVVLLPRDDRFPDAVFVEDTAVVTDEVAVIARPGAASRRGETEAVAGALAGRRRVRIAAPARLDGGDVLRMGMRVYVGRSGRTNAEGFAALREALAPFGYGVTAVETTGCLHLKSAAAAVGEDMLLVNPQWVDPGVFGDVEILAVAAEEPAAANVLRLDTTLLVSDAYPRTRERLERRGLAPRALSVDEFHKAEGGLTCMSILLREEG